MRIGEARIRVLRLTQYANLGTFVASLLTGLTVGAFPLWLVLVAMVPLVILALVDPSVLKGEFQYQNQNNEEWRAVVQDIKAIKEKLYADSSNKG